MTSVVLVIFAYCARVTGLEPAAFPVTGECSNQLSYTRKRGVEDARAYSFSECRGRMSAYDYTRRAPTIYHSGRIFK